MEDNFRNNSFDEHHNHNRHSAEPGQTSEAIPIRVIHERTPTTQKNRLSAANSRNTTEIPARTESPNNIQSEKSPRLERAHSEPPKLFNQRLRPGGAASPALQQAYSTIPENSEPPSVGSPRIGTRQEPEALTPNHKLASSASAPSVPGSNQSRPSPVPPPRRNKVEREEDKSGKEQVPQTPHPPPPPQQQQPNPEAPKVRHIPIFVEGRDEPVVHRKTSGGDASTGFRQPSDFYPPNIQKARSQSVSSPGAGSGSGGSGGFGRGLNLKPHPHQQFSQEPTSPLSPPPSDQPIPMGCSDYFVHPTEQKKTEPESPAAPPPGPIPMPFCPDSVDSPAAPEVHNVPVKIVETPEPQEKPEPKVEPPKNVSPAEAKLRKIETEVEELLQRVEKFNGCKKDREYLYLDDLLTQKLCILDGIESEGRDDIRKMRKDSIKTINRCLSMLDRRATPKASSAKVDKNCDDNSDAEVANKVLSDLAKAETDNVDRKDHSDEKEAPKK